MLIRYSTKTKIMKISFWSDTEDEKEEILNLTKKTFGDVEITNPSYYDWQYKKNPNGKALITIARNDSDNEIVGINSIIPLELLVDGEEIKSSLACNVQVHPDHRKKRIFSKLLSSMPKFALSNNIQSLFAVPNDNSFKAFINEGSTEIAQLPLLVKPIKFSQYFDSPIKQILKPFDIFWKRSENHLFEIEQFNDDFDYSFEELAKKTSKRVSVLVSRKKEFLNWRYKNHPTRSYQIFILRDKNELAGYIITRIHHFEKKKIGVILDYMVNENFKDQTLLKGLIDKALFNFWKNDVSIAITICRDGLLENRLLRNSGFFKPPSFLKPVSLHFVIQNFENNLKLKKLSKFENWFFAFGDYDVF